MWFLDVIDLVRLLYLAVHFKVQAQDTEEKISKEFEELREILRNEEVARITVLREEEKLKSQMIKEKTEKTSKQIVSLKCAIRDVEEQMNAEDDSFLQVPINAHRQTQTYECHFQK